MDPNATLAKVRRLSARLRDRNAFVEPGTSTTDMLLAGRRLAELIQSLDDWLTRAGFLPTAWDHKCPDCGQTVGALPQ
jgi:hypothetical protein